jgi:hypothetical protein
MRGRDNSNAQALKEKQMTKLEELKAAADADAASCTVQ